MNELILDIFIRSCFLAALGLVCLWTVRKLSASVQHAVGCLAIATLLALPVLRFVIPQIRLYWLPAPKASPIYSIATAPQTPQLLSSGHLTPQAVSTEFVNPWVILWAIGMLVLVIRYVFGWLTFRRWVQAGSEVCPENGTVKIVQSTFTRVPLTGWLGQNIIVVPVTWSSWPEDKLSAALLHETAHIYRRDWLTQLLAKLACAVLWPNPLVWLIAKSCRTMAERAADDEVLTHGVPSTQYAQTLLEIAREANATLPAQCGATVSMAKEFDVARRIEMILDTNTRRTSVSPTLLIFAGIALTSFAAPAACLAIAQKSIPAAPNSGTTSTPSSTGIYVSLFLPQPHTHLSTTGIAPLLKNDKSTHIQAESFPKTYVFELSKKDTQDLIAKWKADGVLNSNPSLLTTSGTKASISLSKPNGLDTVNVDVLPKLNKDKSISIELNVEVVDQLVEVTQATTFKVHPGTTMLVTKQSKIGDYIEVLCLISARLTDKQ